MQSFIILATFLVLSIFMSLVVLVLDRADIEHFHHCRKFYLTALF